ncbi:hypothetical protein COCNU_scaffold004995G000010 [Cocos nucifera]|nr:hypothetical protein [Cocos nucifera]
MGQVETVAEDAGEEVCRTPRAAVCRIPAKMACPPAPRKRRKSPCPAPPPKEFFVSPELDAFFAAHYKALQNPLQNM